MTDRIEPDASNASPSKDLLAKALALDPSQESVQAALTTLEQTFGSTDEHARAMAQLLESRRALARAHVEGARPRSRHDRQKASSDAVTPEIERALNAALGSISTLAASLALPPQDSDTTWENAIGNQRVNAAFKFHPRTLGDVVAVVRFAEAAGRRVRAVGSGHSFSDVALAGSHDVLVDTHSMNDPLDLEEELLKPGHPPLFRVEGGIRLIDLLQTLDVHGLAIQNMGNYAEQTIVGATATGTHGTGLEFGPLAEQIQSIELVASGGKVYRIEPAGGITDPGAFKAREAQLAAADPAHIPVELVQDDDMYRSAALGLGCLGIIYAVTLQVVPRYWLTETRKARPWAEVREELREELARLSRGEPPQLLAPRHYELLLNPYEIDGQHTCLVTVREMASEPTGPSFLRPHRPLTGKLLSIIPGSGKGLAWLTNQFPALLPGVVDENIRGQEDEGYVNLSYEVLQSADIGIELLDALPDHLTGFSASMAFPLSTAIDAIEHILARKDAPAPQHMTGPIKIRFVKPSRLFLAMQNGEASEAAVCMVEPMLLLGSTGGFENLHWVMSSTLAFGGRPHWGLNFAYMDDAPIIDRLTRPYPALDRFLSVYRTLNPHGTFDNAFTDRNRLRARLEGRPEST
ncbi:MAG TPA: FAD-binding protein [Polyangiaceae bacterium]|nr:FAD-binding protein [Polyangiaceae bacterium]